MYATYMRLEKRPMCRLLSPLPERPIQASNNHCSNTAAYLYIFYQKFEPHSKNPMPASPRLVIPARPPRIPRHKAGAPRRPQDTPPPPSFRPRRSRESGNLHLGTQPTPVTQDTPPPTERPLGPRAWRLRPVELLPADAQVSADTLDRSCGQIPIGVSRNGGLTVIVRIYPDLV